MQNSGLPWISPKKTVGIDLSSLTDFFGVNILASIAFLLHIMAKVLSVLKTEPYFIFDRFCFFSTLTKFCPSIFPMLQLMVFGHCAMQLYHIRISLSWLTCRH